VFKSFLGKSFGAEAEKPAARTADDSVDVGYLRALFEFFPLGRKLRYCPEFKKEIVFDTLLVGYCLNGQFVYTGDAVQCDDDGNPSAFRVRESAPWMPIGKLKLFQLLVPDTTDLELTLDYSRRALIGRGRQFNKGNYISLLANAGAKGMCALDTEVAKQVVLADGPYAHTKMILLTPEWRSLAVTDQRHKARAKTCAPVMLSVAGGRLTGPCTIVDVSDEAMRIRVRDRDSKLPAMSPGDSITLDIDLGDDEHRYRIRGEVFRRSAETCVIRLAGLLRDDGKLARFDPLALLELKAALLNYGT
jgi:hypothetical protein